MNLQEFGSLSPEGRMEIALLWYFARHPSAGVILGLFAGPENGENFPEKQTTEYRTDYRMHIDGDYALKIMPKKLFKIFQKFFVTPSGIFPPFLS